MEVEKIEVFFPPSIFFINISVPLCLCGKFFSLSEVLGMIVADEVSMFAPSF
jgi:hypothetical protein